MRILVTVLVAAMLMPVSALADHQPQGKRPAPPKQQTKPPSTPPQPSPNFQPGVPQSPFPRPQEEAQSAEEANQGELGTRGMLLMLVFPFLVLGLAVLANRLLHRRRRGGNWNPFRKNTAPFTSGSPVASPSKATDAESKKVPPSAPRKRKKSSKAKNRRR